MSFQNLSRVRARFGSGSMRPPGSVDLRGGHPASERGNGEGGLTALTSAPQADEELVRSLGADLIVKTNGDPAAGIRRELPDGPPGLIDGATLNEAILPAIADGGSLVTLKGWNGPGERNISIHPISSFDFASVTARFDRVRELAEDGALTLRVAEVMPATQAGEAQRRLAAGGIRGRLVLDFSGLW